MDKNAARFEGPPLARRAARRGPPQRRLRSLCQAIQRRAAPWPRRAAPAAEWLAQLDKEESERNDALKSEQMRVAIRANRIAWTAAMVAAAAAIVAIIAAVISYLAWR